jgi:hypothetical protein
MSITFSVCGHENDLNIANGNFQKLCDLLDIAYFDWCGSVSGDSLIALRDKIDFVLTGIAAMPELDGGTASYEKAPNWIECGLPEGYYARRLSELRGLVTAAIANESALMWG